MKKLLKLIAVGVVLVVCYAALTKGKNNSETVRTTNNSTPRSPTTTGTGSVTRTAATTRR